MIKPVPQEPTGVAVIGCGQWGPHHVRNFLQQKNCRVTAVDQDGDRLRQVTATYPEVKVTADYVSVMKDRHISAVVIATPPQTHAKLVRESLLAGKHVLCEKPLCDSTADALRLVELARSVRRTLMTGHTYLFNSGLRELKRQIDGDELGAIRYLAAKRTNLGPIRTDVNVAFDLATHDVAVFNWLLNAEPDEVSATGATFLQRGLEDVVFIHLRYSANRVAHIHAGWMEPLRIRQMTIVGTTKMALWDDLESNGSVTIFDREVRVDDANDAGQEPRMQIHRGAARQLSVDAIEPLKLQAETFLRAVRRGVGDPNQGTFEIGVIRTLEMIDRSIKESGRPISRAEIILDELHTSNRSAMAGRR